MAVELKNVAAN